MMKIRSDGTISGIAKNENRASMNFVSPYTLNYDGNPGTLWNSSKYGCNKNAQYPSYCAKIIKDNDWTIPRNYPW